MRVPTRYQLTTFARRPIVAYRRRRLGDATPIAIYLLDATGWRRSMFRFLADARDDPGLLYEADLDGDSRVVDLGAHHGEWAAAMVERYGCQVAAFEPSPAALTVIEEKLGADDRVQIHPWAVGASDGQATLSEDGPGASLHRSSRTYGSSPVEVRDVDAALRQLGWYESGVDLLKVNIEGAEYEVFDRLWDRGWFPKLRLVSVQFHDFYPGAHRRRRAIRRRLRRTHDEVWCYPWVWELWRRRD